MHYQWSTLWSDMQWQLCIHNTTPCLKKVPLLTCYNLDIPVHSSITIVFGTSATEKVGNQNVLYFPTSHTLCFCTTWGNRKPPKCAFSLKCCILFTKNNTNTLSKWSTGCTRQDVGSCCVLPTCMLYINQNCHSVGRCVKDGSCSLSSLSESQRTVLIGYLTISTNVDAIKHSTDDNFSFRKTAHWCTVHATQSICSSARN